MSESPKGAPWGLIIILVLVALALIGLAGYFLGMEWAGGISAASLAAGKILKDKAARDTDRAVIQEAQEDAEGASLKVRVAIGDARTDMRKAEREVAPLADGEKVELAKDLFKKPGGEA